MIRLYLFLFLVLSSLTLAAQADLTAALQQVGDDYNLTGMSVIVTCGEEVETAFHYGRRDIARNLPVTDSTRFRIASISKMISALGMMKLYEDSLVGLDDDVNDYLDFDLVNPNFPTAAITIRDVLSHRTGIVDGAGYFNFLTASYATDLPPNLSELLTTGGNYYTTDVFTNRAPGTYFQYSNLNYGLVGTLIESISGQRFDTYIEANILAPLGIQATFLVDNLPELGSLSVLYRNGSPSWDNYGGVFPTPRDLSGYVPGTNAVIFSPQGGLRASARELSDVLQMLAHEGSWNGVTVLEPATVATFISDAWTFNGTNGNNYFDLFNSWGLGIQRTTNTPGGDVIIPGSAGYGHAGEAYGLISDAYFFPDQGRSITLVINGYYGADYYAFGTNSAFYAPEEAVFAAVNQFAGAGCALGTHVSEVAAVAIQVYPNPTKGILHLTGSESPRSAVAYDLLGRSTPLAVGDRQIDASNLATGVYLLRLERMDGRVIFQRIVVE